MTITSTYTLDEKTGAFTRHDTQDVGDILRSNAQERNSGENTNRFDNARKIASVPMVVLEALKKRDMKDGGPIDFNLVGYDPDHTIRFARWLNDRDNIGFRTSDAKLEVNNVNRYL